MADNLCVQSLPPLIAKAIGRFEDRTAELLRWIKDLGGSDFTSARILNDKGWSLVVQFGPVVLKVTAAGMFPDGPRFFQLVSRASPSLVPEIIAWRPCTSGGQAMLFRTFEGAAIDNIALAVRSDALVSMAVSTARIQAAVGALPAEKLKAFGPRDLPAMLDELLAGAVPECRKDHGAGWSSHCQNNEVSSDFVKELPQWRSAVEEWAEELAGGGWASSVDHVDLLPHNAHILSDGSCLIYDWEQATIGVPFFSLDVLLAYAQSVDEGREGLVLGPERATTTQGRIRDAYLGELQGPLDLSLRLAPLRYCMLEWNQAVCAGVPHYGVDDVVWWLSRALRRWKQVSAASFS